MSKIPVLEIFGPTIQGEGMVVGRKTMFIRTAGCDYRCSWCDSAFTWDGTGKDDIIQMTAEEIWERLSELGGDRFDHVTISGGNPALLTNLRHFIELAKQKNIQLALETQGSKWQDWFEQIDDLTISPKPPSSGMKTNFAILDDIITKLSDANSLFSLKVVVFDEADYEYAIHVHQRYPNVPFYLQVGNDDITNGNNEELLQKLLTKYEWLIDLTMNTSEMNDVRVLPQLHALVWGNKRGV
ncbi:MULTISPECIES: 7-carboxy-7-deazaguanine synthase QueE [Bacillaceae]|uniref:7-carboxy-7-deazaguanine synthase QueE n=1 Tax=Bacillaceae TaxID=186817 RepID=UPI001E30B77E|nr:MULTISPECIES: 7-carboxy-7-deazaguanine synthase QueE [Bacillaceae]MCE4047727.1 7-carboxy-7-deazaguanine synthase QueE [Bacillus sp. Au-Bac7]MCM3031174.1 7-carboxy-7-deazaguanine synthase QueE [Niallia sp. MER 6]